MIKVFWLKMKLLSEMGSRTVLIGKCMDMTLSERQVMENLRYR